MTISSHPDDVVGRASVSDDVFALRPDYRALLVAVDGFDPRESLTPNESAIGDLLARAEASARGLDPAGLDGEPHVVAWRAAYRGFGAKPQRTRPSLEALLRRAGSGLPRVNPLTDAYNAISVLHRVPIGGEDLDHYTGPARLVRAEGTEPFDTMTDGAEVVEHPEPGEVVWRDDAGVTCRRWNWRQARRTRLRPETTRALFILDALDPMTDEALLAAGDELVAVLAAGARNLRAGQRLIGPA